MSQPHLPGRQDIAKELQLACFAIVDMVDSATIIVEGVLVTFDRLGVLTNDLLNNKDFNRLEYEHQNTISMSHVKRVKKTREG